MVVGVRLLLCSGLYPKLLGYQAASCSQSSQEIQIPIANRVQGVRNAQQPSLSHGMIQAEGQTFCHLLLQTMAVLQRFVWGHFLLKWEEAECLSQVCYLESRLKVEISEKFGVWLGFFTET